MSSPAMGETVKVCPLGLHCVSVRLDTTNLRVPHLTLQHSQTQHFVVGRPRNEGVSKRAGTKPAHDDVSGVWNMESVFHISIASEV